MILSDMLTDMLPSLNAASEADLGYWTMAELHAFTDEAAKRLARATGGFVERDTSITLEA